MLPIARERRDKGQSVGKGFVCALKMALRGREWMEGKDRLLFRSTFPDDGTTDEQAGVKGSEVEVL